jgi:outer membrane receptor protein involved in Fe transport
MKHLYYFLLFIGCFFTQFAHAQTTVSGRVVDAETNEWLTGVMISSKQLVGTATDADGKYSISIPGNVTELTFRYLGYETQVIPLKLAGSKSISLSLKLLTQASILNTVTVTGGRHERLLENEIATIEVIPPRFIENNAITSLAEVMERTPGVQILDDQVNIRSSGFSYGGGSRVGLVVDGQPLLGALFGDIKWNFIPIENAGQIEVVKSAASVLYGSNAMNGIINVTTAEPTSDPYTSISIYRGVMDSPPTKYRQWWDDDEPPYNVGLFFAHRVKATKKLDVTFGGNMHFNRSHIQDGDEARYRVNWKTKYRLNDRTTFGLNGNFMYHSLGGYFIWQDADTNALRHITPVAPSRYRTFSLDPHFTHFDRYDNKHTVQGRYFNITETQWLRSKQQIAENQADIPATVYGGEYQFQRRFDNQLLLTAGMSYQRFSADNPTLTFTEPDSTTRLSSFGNNQALFGQLEYGFFNNKLQSQVGLRLERFNVGDGDFKVIVPVVQAGATYKVTPSNVFRTSFGQGYRLPSLLERYVETQILVIETPFITIPLQAIPNLDIIPEYGWNYELGYKKLLKKGRWKGYLDAAFFMMQYRNMSELMFDVHLTDEEIATLPAGEIFNNLGFKYVDEVNGRIAGYEVSAHLNGNILGMPIRVWGGYTYAYPGDLDSLEALNQSYWGNFFDAMGTPDSTMLPTVMRYRSLHTARIDVEFDLFKILTIGGIATFNGFMHNIDAVFEGGGEWGETIEGLNGGPIIPGTVAFRESQLGGDWVFDVRASAEVAKGHRVHFIVTNMMNREYALRIGKMNRLRMFNVKYQMTF